MCKMNDGSHCKDCERKTIVDGVTLRAVARADSAEIVTKVVLPQCVDRSQARVVAEVCARARRQTCALKASPGTAARSAEIWRPTLCSIASRSRTSFVLLILREWLELLSAATTRPC